ncbi:hypothetical protein PFAG_02901 [Plasmodium falciparum Santa Lucia]|uniref:protein-histidine N-methyltransferase n=11 Tax=Plasmodium falciparum TaxID=5833 RepID=C6S3D3_PLAF7|nr:methyltransferase, putative [Plasmodium falciparum 3D7]ETW18395.1 hypothetical protein PFFVO_02911 [Plasmodium falciparum Vietnam Oak-Knoll (FVO)]ETW30630.1 hypothetical protein PFFCH_01932 [Plasmodium falciparum FCH/4]ETW42401.1 hypothetical protein PFNF135_03063 [Plasmodium falciparum NF135/5.C10]ETW56646.1 hypothetical protein PFUGPA_01436 [Plasmodium falciparum Palo Alto/Uganda]ETW61211.1 hypothetical protein PFMC_02898 [Plasmodium falciparum CAMP/Malaysia]EUR71966.1 hypothetical prote|eukprot:XP_002585410.1 conserved Plasmodium protein, unknown function [Plasmodium falciparum 3D7]
MYEVYYLNEHDEFEKKKKKNEEIQSSLILKNHAISSEKKSKLVKHNIYEGGYTIWECTWDMLKFFHKEGFDFNNKQVLELGCGHGLVGIKVLLDNGNVVFQELNKEVINDVLLPNIKKNLKMKLKKKKLKENKHYMKINNDKITCYVINKPWHKLNSKLQKKKLNCFDFILGNEILYRKENYYHILKILKKNLKKGGKAYFGSKSYYFGFEDGTGSNSFVTYVNNNEHFNFVARIIQTTTGKSVYSKDIIEVTFSPNND